MNEETAQKICFELQEINKSLQAIASSLERSRSNENCNINQIAKELHSFMPKTFVKTA